MVVCRYTNSMHRYKLLTFAQYSFLCWWLSSLFNNGSKLLSHAWSVWPIINWIQYSVQLPVGLQNLIMQRAQFKHLSVGIMAKKIGKQSLLWVYFILRLTLSPTGEGGGGVGVCFFFYFFGFFFYFKNFFFGRGNFFCNGF